MVLTLVQNLMPSMPFEFEHHPRLNLALIGAVNVMAATRWTARPADDEVIYLAHDTLLYVRTISFGRQDKYPSTINAADVN